MLVFLVFVCFCVIVLVIFRQSQNKMQALYMGQTGRHFVMLCTVCRNFFHSGSKFVIISHENAVGFYFFVLYSICFCLFVCLFLIKSTTLL